MIVLNVGGGSRHLPPEYEGWDGHLLDINPDCQPDLCMDGKDLITYDAMQFDAVLCSHNLEHYYRHDVAQVLAGFLHVLKDGGHADIRVPNIMGLFSAMARGQLDIDDVWYRAGGSPVTFHDVMYGWNTAMENGNLFYAHKCGFSPLSLAAAMQKAGFKDVQIKADELNIQAIGKK